MKIESAQSLLPFKARRAKLAKTIAQATPGAIIVLPTARELIRNDDNTYPFRFDSHFYYLTGFKEPDAVLVMVPVEGKGKKVGTYKEILFVRPKDETREIWEGYRYGPDMAKQAFGFDEAFAIDQLESQLPQLFANQSAIYTPFGQFDWWDAIVTKALNTTRAKRNTRAPASISELREVTSAMRLVKDAHEIALMRKSGAIASKAHRRAMRFTKPGVMEFQVEAEILHEFKMHGAQDAAYGSIVAGGANACILHYHANDQRLKDGDLLLIDAGCELDGYASDITRTFPVSGKFSGPQKAIYELVLASQFAAIDCLKPGAAFHNYHDAATRVLVQGFKDLKFVKGSVDAIIEQSLHRQFYMHGTGHWLGLDVHDAGHYRGPPKAGQTLGDSVKLAAGMVVTVEPGCYLRPAENIPEKFWNIGVRIEDDVLVTCKGHENLTASCPKTIADVEAACRD